MYLTEGLNQLNWTILVDKRSCRNKENFIVQKKNKRPIRLSPSVVYNCRVTWPLTQRPSDNPQWAKIPLTLQKPRRLFPHRRPYSSYPERRTPAAMV